MWREHFSKLAIHLAHPPFDNMYRKATQHKLLDIEISKDFLEYRSITYKKEYRAFCKIKLGKATGNDQVTLQNIKIW